MAGLSAEWHGRPRLLRRGCYLGPRSPSTRPSAATTRSAPRAATPYSLNRCPLLAHAACLRVHPRSSAPPRAPRTPDTVAVTPCGDTTSSTRRHRAHSNPWGRAPRPRPRALPPPGRLPPTSPAPPSAPPAPRKASAWAAQSPRPSQWTAAGRRSAARARRGCRQGRTGAEVRPCLGTRSQRQLMRSVSATRQGHRRVRRGRRLAGRQSGGPSRARLRPHPPHLHKGLQVWQHSQAGR